MAICPKCQQENPATARFCANCGEQLAETPLSPQVSAEVTTGDVAPGGTVIGIIDTAGGDVNILRGEEQEKSLQLKSWSDICHLAKAQSERTIKTAPDRPRPSDIYIPDLYISRKSTEDTLWMFLRGREVGLVLVGDTGTGKTNLLYNWAIDLIKADHAVFIYNCGGSVSPEVESELTRDFSLIRPASLPAMLQLVNTLAQAADRYFVFIFDAVNEFQPQPGSGPAELLKQIDSLVARFPKENVRLLLSCNNSVWNSMTRNSDTNLYWNFYYQPAGNETVLSLDIFTPIEFEAAYQKYQAFFNLYQDYADLAPDLKERLRKPLVLRLLSEAYRDQDEAFPEDFLALGIFRKFYDQRVSWQDQRFLEDLADEMMRQQRSSLSVSSLRRSDRFSEQFAHEDPNSGYFRMLDKGILSDTPRPQLSDSMVKFTLPSLGAFIVAKHWLSDPEAEQQTPEELVQKAAQFPMAWDVARSILLLSEDKQELFKRLAQSTDVEHRELVVDALVRLHAEEAATTTEIIKLLLGLESTEANRASLKAAYLIGPSARDIFLYAATGRSASLRQAAKDTLYLVWRMGALETREEVRDALYAIWHHDPDFTYSLLNDLADKADFKSPFVLQKLLEFISDLSITIYINHCDRKDIVQHTSDLWYKILKTRLGLDRMDLTKLPQPIQGLLYQVVSRVFSKKLMDTVLFTELVPPDRLFTLPEEEKARFKSVVPLVDPATDILASRDDLEYLLRSDLILFNILAATVLSVHACQKFSAIESLLNNLFDSLNGYGRMWELIAFATLLSETPSEWLPLVENFTRRLIEENPEVFFGEEAGFMQQFDIILVPLGLAYGKQGLEMSYFQELLSQDDTRLVQRVIKGLGAVGFYYPLSVFHTLQAVEINFDDQQIQEALVPALATIRTLHFDAVDIFLNQIKANDNLKRLVAASADVELVRRYIYWLGIYNNAVHQSLHYPKMRRNLLMGGLNALADARKTEDFIASYTPIPIRMVWEAEFRLSEWTLPE